MRYASFDAAGIDLHGRTTGQAKVTCPRCSHTRNKPRDPCLSVNIDEGLWHCHHCLWEGRVSTGADDYGTLPKVFRKPDYQPAEQPLAEPRSLAWLHERGLTDPVIARNRLDYRTIFMPQVGREVMAITYPYFRDGEIVNVKYRDGHKNFRMEKDAELCLYGLDDIDPEAP